MRILQMVKNMIGQIDDSYFKRYIVCIQDRAYFIINKNISGIIFLL